MRLHLYICINPTDSSGHYFDGIIEGELLYLQIVLAQISNALYLLCDT